MSIIMPMRQLCQKFQKLLRSSTATRIIGPLLARVLTCGGGNISRMDIASFSSSVDCSESLLLVQLHSLHCGGTLMVSSLELSGFGDC